ncbi:MAG: hypothetical protein H5T41_09840 [Methanomassiliicoccales archaeon]|nr:hypothetical protein [Methanomassiliicoccales archaeon]
MFDKDYDPVAKRLIEKLPLFLKEEVISQARTHQKIVAKPLQDADRDTRLAMTLIDLDRPLLIWREQDQPHSYTINFKVSLKDIMRVKVYEDGWKIYDSGKLEKGVNIFVESIQRETYDIIPDHRYLLKVEDYHGNTYEKGIPESYDETGAYQPDPVLDRLGKLHNIPRLRLKPVDNENLHLAYPKFHNQSIEPDYYYMQRIKDYLRIFQDRGLIYAEFYKWLTVIPDIVGYWRVLSRQNQTEQVFQSEGDVGSYEMATKDRNASTYIVYLDPEKIPLNVLFDSEKYEEFLRDISLSKKFFFEVPIEVSITDTVIFDSDVDDTLFGMREYEEFITVDDISSADTTTSDIPVEISKFSDMLSDSSVADVVPETFKASDYVSETVSCELATESFKSSDTISTADTTTSNAVADVSKFSESLTTTSATGVDSETGKFSDSYSYSAIAYIRTYDTDTQFNSLSKSGSIVISGTGTSAVITTGDPTSTNTGAKQPTSATNVSYTNCGSGFGYWYYLSRLTDGCNDYGAAADSAAKVCYTDILRASGYSFGVPSNARITGIVVNIRRRQSGTVNRVDQLVRINVGGTNSTNKADTSTYWPQSYATKTYGGSTDLWGLSNVTPSNINTLYVDLSAKNNYSAGATFYVDCIKVTVYYKVPASGTVSYTLSGSEVGVGNNLGYLDLKTSIPEGSISYEVKKNGSTVKSGSVSSGTSTISLTDITVGSTSDSFEVKFTLTSGTSNKPSIDYIKHLYQVSGNL